MTGDCTASVSVIVSVFRVSVALERSKKVSQLKNSHYEEEREH